MNQTKKNVALHSVFASFGLTIFKLIVGLLTGSIGIISEAAHSALDIGAALITYFAVRVSDKPADLIHQYGHGKVESISALIETALLLLTSIWIIYEAILRLISNTTEVQVTWYAFVVMIISIVIDFNRSRALYKVAKKTNSQALEADALHFSSDIYSSAAVLLGLIFVLFGVKSADAIAAICVGIVVARASYQLGKRTFDVLVDTAPTGLSQELKDTVAKVDGVVSLDRLRVRPAGPTYFIDMSISISRKAPLEEINKIKKTILERIHKISPSADVVMDMKAVAIGNETAIERIQAIAANHGMNAHDIFIQVLETKKYINFDLETNKTFTVEQANKAVNHIEKAIREEMGEDIGIETHIEPADAKSTEAQEVSENEYANVYTIISDIKKEYKNVLDIHRISAHKAKGKIYLSLHAVFDKRESLKEAHSTASKIESRIREILPNVDHILVHIEPLKN